MNNCLICNKEFTQKPSTSGKYCSISCGNRSRKGLDQKSTLIKKENVIIYLTNPKKCLKCNATIEYDKKSNNFCGQSCSASFTNSNRDKSIYNKSSITLKKTIGQNNITMPQNIRKISKISFCSICNKLIPNKEIKSCSKECKIKLLSLSLRGKTGGSTKQFIKVKDSFGKEVSLDSSWELTLSEDLNINNIKWTRPSSFLLSNGRKYTPDFYLPDYKIYLDPKAYRKGYLLQIEKIAMFEKEFDTTCLVISSKNLLNWKHIESKLAGDAPRAYPH